MGGKQAIGVFLIFLGVLLFIAALLGRVSSVFAGLLYGESALTNKAAPTPTKEKTLGEILTPDDKTNQEIYGDMPTNTVGGNVFNQTPLTTRFGKNGQTFEIITTPTK